MAFFDAVPLLPPDPIFGLATAFHADPRPMKVNLNVGIYMTEELKTPILKSVKKAEAFLLGSEETKNYLPIDGDRTFLKEVAILLFGEPFCKRASARLSASQAVGGTGALRTGGEFLRQQIGKEIYLSDPTWINHKMLFERCGFALHSYPYYDREKRQLDFERLYDFLSKLKERSIVLLQASCHNPTGADLTLAQWQELSTLFFAKRLFPFFDFAYQGFEEGLNEDAKAIRLFAEAGHEMLVATSYSKNFTLYAERTGALFVLCNSEKTAQNVSSVIKPMIRTNISNPPQHGAKIVSHILGTPALKQEWTEEVTLMRQRAKLMRKALAQALVAKSQKKDFHFLENCSGLFSFSGLNKTQVAHLITEYGIYMTGDGRINVCGLNEENLPYVVDAILTVSERRELQ